MKPLICEMKPIQNTLNLEETNTKRSGGNQQMLLSHRKMEWTDRIENIPLLGPTLQSFVPFL